MIGRVYTFIMFRYTYTMQMAWRVNNEHCVDKKLPL